MANTSDGTSTSSSTLALGSRIDAKTRKASDSILFAWFAGSLASCGAVTFTNPFE
ncbi:hypothetical protein FB639_000700, partial [Coemansia asiatica]